VAVVKVKAVAVVKGCCEGGASGHTATGVEAATSSSAPDVIRTAQPKEAQQPKRKSGINTARRNTRAAEHAKRQPSDGQSDGHRDERRKRQSQEETGAERTQRQTARGREQSDKAKAIRRREACMKWRRARQMAVVVARVPDTRVGASTKMALARETRGLATATWGDETRTPSAAAAAAAAAKRGGEKAGVRRMRVRTACVSGGGRLAHFWASAAPLAMAWVHGTCAVVGWAS
jgi:hypothetical protein